MLFFRCSEDSFNGFFSQFIYRFVPKGMTDVFCHFHIFFPNMTHYYLHMIFAFRTFMETWAIGT